MKSFVAIFFTLVSGADANKYFCGKSLQQKGRDFGIGFAYCCDYDHAWDSEAEACDEDGYTKKIYNQCEKYTNALYPSDRYICCQKSNSKQECHSVTAESDVELKDQNVEDEDLADAESNSENEGARNKEEQHKAQDHKEEAILPYTSNLFFAEMQPLEFHGPVGWVAVAVTPGGLVGVGLAQSLEAKLRAGPDGANCTATNGCGTHVHSGSACTDATTQGGHYFAANMTDPWASIGYTFTTRRGFTVFKFSIDTTAQNISQKPFIIHNNAGGRVTCGLLSPMIPAKLPKHVAQLLHADRMPTIEELEDEEDEEDDDDNEEGDADDKSNKEKGKGHDNERRLLSAPPILI